MLSPAGDMVLVSPKEDVMSSAIHMAFMRYPIDVVWADSEGKVVDVQRSIPPLSLFSPSTWKTYRPKKPAKYVVELGKNTAGKTEEGDVLRFS